MKRPVWLRAQSDSYSCGAWSLKYAAYVLGVEATEDEIRKLAGTGWWHGTGHEGMIEAAERLRLRAAFRTFVAGQRDAAWRWLVRQLQREYVVVLVIDHFEHYVAAVSLLDDGRVVLIDSSGDDNDDDWADVAAFSRRSLLARWRSTDDEDDGFWGIALAPRRRERRRLGFNAEAVRRYRRGRRHLLDEFLVDTLEIAELATGSKGARVPLSHLIREAARTCVLRQLSWWWGTDSRRDAELRHAADDLAIAAEANRLVLPTSARATVATALASLLAIHLDAC